MFFLRALVILGILGFSLSSCAEAAVGVAIVFQGEQDKYIPCVVMSAANDRVAFTSNELRQLGCLGQDIFAETSEPQFVDSLSRLVATQRATPGRSVLCVVKDRGKTKRLISDLHEAVITVRSLLQYFPDASGEVESNFIQRLPQ